jgi:hypothetical protein
MRDLGRGVVHRCGDPVATRRRLQMLEGELRLVGDRPQHTIGSAGDVNALAAAGQAEHVARSPGNAVGAVPGLARSRDDVVQFAARLQLGAQRVAGADAQIARQNQRRGRREVGAQALAQVERDHGGPRRRVERAAALGQKLVARHRRILQRERVARVEVARPARVRRVGDGRPLALVPALADRLQLRRHPVVPHAAVPPCHFFRAALSSPDAADATNRSVIADGEPNLVQAPARR